MVRHRPFRLLFFVILILAATLSASLSHAGLKDHLKQKFEKKAGDKTGQAADKAIDGAADGATGAGAAAGEGDGSESAENSDGGGDSGKVSDVSTKFDFIPGDNVLFTDDFTQDELGEFPARWKLAWGTFEVAEREGERWLRCVSTDGRVRMKLPAMDRLPEFWTLEFDFFGVEPMASALSVIALGAGDRGAWEATFPHDRNMAFRSGEIFSSTPLEGSVSVPGRHHVMFMARGTALKGYIDRQRLVSVPDISVPAGLPIELEIRLWATTKPMIANVRFAEGCKPAKDMLASGKLVTYGIRFASGSDVVMPESAPVLRQIAAYLQANPAVKLQIVGHTDNTGTAAGNLDLSKRRAASVARVLVSDFQIAADRFSTDGKGDTESVASNSGAEGRAMNRRVEFRKA